MVVLEGAILSLPNIRSAWWVAWGWKCCFVWVASAGTTLCRRCRMSSWCVCGGGHGKGWVGIKYWSMSRYACTGDGCYSYFRLDEHFHDIHGLIAWISTLQYGLDWPHSFYFFWKHSQYLITAIERFDKGTSMCATSRRLFWMLASQKRAWYGPCGHGTAKEERRTRKVRRWWRALIEVILFWMYEKIASGLIVELNDFRRRKESLFTNVTGAQEFLEWINQPRAQIIYLEKPMSYFQQILSKSKMFFYETTSKINLEPRYIRFLRCWISLKIHNLLPGSQPTYSKFKVRKYSWNILNLFRNCRNTIIPCPSEHRRHLAFLFLSYKWFQA